MKAIQFSEHGGRDVIEYAEGDEPERGESEVLVDVKAAALNHLDVWTRRGLPGLDLEMPQVPGSDAAGRVSTKATASLSGLASRVATVSSAATATNRSA
jgi:NADPH:quinone reductase-like Zn-dependent oxidoreductase